MAAQNHDYLNELAALLAAGFLRVFAQKSSPLLLDGAKNRLDCEAKPEGDGCRTDEEYAP